MPFLVTFNLPDGTSKIVKVYSVPQRGDYCYIPDDKTFIPQDATYRVAKVEHCIMSFTGHAEIYITLELS